MSINTTKTLQRSSSVLARRCEATEKNMQKLMREALCPQAEMVEITLPYLPGSRDDVVFVGLNGAPFYFLRGRRVRMPQPVAQILRNTGVIA